MRGTTQNTARLCSIPLGGHPVPWAPRPRVFPLPSVGPCSSRNECAPRVTRRYCAVTARASSTTIETGPAASSAPSPQDSFDFACPICLTTKFNVPTSPSPYQRRCCPRCNRVFEPGNGFLDLTLTSGVEQRIYRPQAWTGTDLFRQPLVSFVYERGWRQNFATAGFPGPEREFEIAMREFEAGDVTGGTLLDASCGTGLFTRLFARSGRFSGVIALDFSESMLQQAQAFFDQDGSAASSRSPIVCVRADIGRLPFETGSLDAVHAGAAIHCWPQPMAAMAEISRVLRPGGVLVASTFMPPAAALGELIGDDVVRPVSQLFNPMRTGGYKPWEEAELREVCAAVGLERFTRTRSRSFIMFAATKPTQQAAAA